MGKRGPSHLKCCGTDRRAAKRLPSAAKLECRNAHLAHNEHKKEERVCWPARSVFFVTELRGVNARLRACNTPIRVFGSAQCATSAVIALSKGCSLPRCRRVHL